jgi:translation elongation factor EF-1alpha
MTVNVVFVGHIDHGKSTLIGRLLYDSESIKDERMTEILRLAEVYKRRFEFAYFLDSFEDELKEERTIDTVSLIFKSKKNYYTITDVPGHKEFIKNMLTGASHADVAVLVVSVAEGVQEQTRRHMFLLKMLGIQQVFVVVNKMDTVKYEKERFEEVKGETEAVLRSFEYRTETYIPISAIEGDNVYRKSKAMDWYTGPTLIETLDGINLSREERPLRFVVQDSYMVESEKILVGRVESGVLRRGDNLLFAPSGINGLVERIMVCGRDLEEAMTGDSIGLLLTNNGAVSRGNVGGLVSNPPRTKTQFLGEAVLLDKRLKKAESLELRCGTARVRCTIKELREKINSETGESIEKYPEEIKEHDAATISLETEPLVIENFVDFPELGRFILIKERKNIGAGVVLSA